MDRAATTAANATMGGAMTIKFLARCRPLQFIAAIACLTVAQVIEAVAADQIFGLERRVPWTTSRVVGSPDPPLSYEVEKTFTNLTWKLPMFAIPEPGTENLLVVQQGGENDRPSKIFRVHDDPAVSDQELFLEISNRLVYSVQFHPGYRSNGWLYVFSNGTTSEKERTNRISRFTIERETPFRCRLDSEKTIIQWRSAGHDGGGIVFGPDGLLYLSTGDGTSDSDGWDSGQDISTLLGRVLRIDVDHPDGTNAYSVPKDNPFVGRPNTRGEIWAYGLRNPWRMSIDSRTGDIWVGNNGQDLWETAHLIRRGENYGWSVYEGSHPFYLHRRRGPTPVVAPTIEHHHSEMRSLTGGLVYHGKIFSELEGAYVYGDYSSGQIWGARHDGSKLTWHQKLAQTQLQIAAFSMDHGENILIVDHSGGIYRLTRAKAHSSSTIFPQRLSDTGVFASTREHRVAPGIIPYSVNAPGWADGARAERFIGLPDDLRIDYRSSGAWDMTNGAVLVQTLSLATESGNGSALRRIETRLLTRQSGMWVGYSYRWDDDQADARLVPSQGAEQEFTVGNFGDQTNSSRRQVWHFPSRTECMACHSRAAGFVLGLSEVQLNRVQDYSGTRADQIPTLNHIGLFTKNISKTEHRGLANPYEASDSLELRARAYLHVNCSGCHVEAGGGNSKMELGIGTTLEKMNLLGARPQHDGFGIQNAMLVAPGRPDNSILLQRLSRRGRGQMPPLVTAVVDEKAMQLVREWISSLPSAQTFFKEWTTEDLLPALAKVKSNRSFDSGETAFRDTGCIQCHRIGGSGGSVGPDLTGVGRRLSARDLLESILLPSKVITEGFAATEIETKSGETITGIVEREDEQSVTLRPMVDAEQPVRVAKIQITRRALSKISNMPAGMANSLTEEQILNLLAYLMADGKSDDSAFISAPAGKN